jgi:hypothetical protein
LITTPYDLFDIEPHPFSREECSRRDEPPKTRTNRAPDLTRREEQEDLVAEEALGIPNDGEERQSKEGSLEDEEHLDAV